MITKTELRLRMGFMFLIDLSRTSAQRRAVEAMVKITKEHTRGVALRRPIVNLREFFVNLRGSS